MSDVAEAGFSGSGSTTDAAAHVQPHGRKASKLNTFALAMAVVSLNASGNLALAWGMKHLPETVGLNPLDYVRAMLSPFVALGVVLLILWLLTRMALMSWADLSFVVPLTAIGYVLAAVLGMLFLDEVVTARHWAGTFLIFAGITLVATTRHRSELPSDG